MWSKMKSEIGKHFRREDGQSVILIGVMIVAILGFLGLALDLGRVFFYRGMLRNAADAASLAAASQYREGRGYSEMQAIAIEVMELNGISPTTVNVQTCDTNPTDPDLCTSPPRKLVRVIGAIEVPMSFLQLVGVEDVTIQEDAIGEAATMDLVLVIDVSESMADDASMCDGDDDDGDGVIDDGRPENWCGGGLSAIPKNGATNDDYYRDPAACNSAEECYPFEEVKNAAKNFIDRILDQPASIEPDRLAIVTFSNGWEADATGVVPPGWITDHGDAINIVDNLGVYNPPKCPRSIGPCRNYDEDDNYMGFECDLYRDTGNPASCTTTNIGGGLKLAGNMFALNSRPSALWVVVLLTDGAANASDSDGGSNPYGYCPSTTWSPPFCRDPLSSTRHASTSAYYDADDFARDMADFVGCYPTSPAAGCTTSGQGAVMFTIGLGNKVLRTYSAGDTAHGVSLLRYIAAVGYDADPATDPCEDLYDTEEEWKEWCGNYYYSPTADQLSLVFEDIASRIFTRISH